MRIDAWTGAIELRQPQEVAFVAPREKAPFMLNRLTPFAVSSNTAAAIGGRR